MPSDAGQKRDPEWQAEWEWLIGQAKAKGTCKQCGRRLGKGVRWVLKHVRLQAAYSICDECHRSRPSVRKALYERVGEEKKRGQSVFTKTTGWLGNKAKGDRGHR